MTHHYVFGYYFPTSHNSLVLRDTQKQTLLRLVSVSFPFPLIIILLIMGGKKSHTQSQTLTLGGGFSWGSAIKISPGFTYKTPSTFFTNLLCMTVVSSIITYQPTATEQWEAIFGKVREIINQWCITGMQCFPHTDWTAHSNALTAAKDIWWLVLASYFQSLIAANNLSQHLPVSLSLTDKLSISTASTSEWLLGNSRSMFTHSQKYSGFFPICYEEDNSTHSL